MYQYTDCYLDNIWLINGYTLKYVSDEQYAEIDQIDGLHELMMNMEVGSILALNKSFYFELSHNGWQLYSKNHQSRRVA